MKLLQDAIKENINGASSLKWGFDPDLNKRVNMVYLPEPVIDLILQWRDEAYGKPSEQQEWQGDAGDKLNEVLKQKGIDPATLKPSEQQETSAAKTFENLQKLLKWLDQRLTALENNETLMPLFKAIVEDLDNLYPDGAESKSELSKLEK